MSNGALGMHLDLRLTWAKHIKTRRKQLNLKTVLATQKKFKTINRKQAPPLYAVLNLIWTYGIQLWGTASISNFKILHCFQAKTLRPIMIAPWYINNHMIPEVQ
jgi:hypothetical protein